MEDEILDLKDEGRARRLLDVDGLGGGKGKKIELLEGTKTGETT